LTRIAGQGGVAESDASNPIPGWHTPRMARRRLIRCLAAPLVAALLVGACDNGPGAAFSPLPVGTCVNYRGLGEQGEELEIVPCSKPHNHVVDAWLPDQQSICPLASETRFDALPGVYCLKLADGSSVTP
jgi:hypothetical protein